MDRLEQSESLALQLDNYVTDIKKFEEDLMPQLDGLAMVMPEIYKGYAKIVHDVVNMGLEICQPSSSSAAKIQLAAEIGARSIKAFGEYKAAKLHNKKLKEYLAQKAKYANANLQIVENLLPKLEKRNASTATLFKKCASIQYDLTDFTDNTMDRIAVIQLKALTMHRTNIFLYELCAYLKAEYHAWIDGNQTSGYEMPDYYLINKMFVQEIYRSDVFSCFEEATECDKQIFGRQVMLLSDFQLSMLALGDRPCRVIEEQAHPLVARLMNNCGAHAKYAEILEPVLKQIDDDPLPAIAFLGILTFVGILCIEFFYIDADFTTKVILGTLSLGAIFKICYKGSRKARIAFVMKSQDICENMDKTVERACGKVEHSEIDYNEQSTLKAAVKGFFS